MLFNAVMICVSPPRVSDDPWSPRSQRKSRRKEKNPYSNRGLDKFATVLADLEERRNKIMAKMGQKDVSLVRFVYSNSHDWVPVVVKLKNPKQGNTEAKEAKRQPIRQNSEVKEVERPKPGGEGKMKKSFSWSLNQSGAPKSWWSYYWPLAMVLILICLVVFGRSFAIICTSIWWYMVPTLQGGDLTLRRSMKKDYMRRLSEKNLGGDGFPLQTKAGAMEGSSPKHRFPGRK